MRGERWPCTWPPWVRTSSHIRPAARGVKVHGMLSAAIKSKDSLNEEKAARVQMTYEVFINLAAFASLFRLRMGKSEV
ncbi:unnamed protein product [Ectocarpus sp. CCAP 1310/34]|nr:unnamed protein product [Ectocarpus sp. CCAP 1310/34]